MENLRSDERIPMDMEIRFRYPKDFHGKVVDYCKRGIGVEIPVELEVDMPIEMEIFKRNFLVEGKVRWVKASGCSITAGIQFGENHYDLIENIHLWTGSFG